MPDNFKFSKDLESNMARVYLSKAKRLSDRFRSWLFGVMKSKGIHQQDIAERLGITQQAVSAKLTGQATITLEDFIQIIDVINPEDDDLLWLLGK